MTSHSGNSSHELTESSASTLSSSEAESSIRDEATLLGRIHYWWSLFVAGALLAIFGPPAISIAWLRGKRELVYPWAEFGARNWLRLSGVKVRVRVRELLDPEQTYVFISNHRSYLDTATLFLYTGRRIGLLAKKELLKVPILGVGMGYVNVLAIDRSNRERALKTTQVATDRIRSGISFGVFAEGTRARPGQLLPFKKGAFYMAAQAGVPIVPVVMKNTDVLMGKGTGVAKPGTIEIVFLGPVSTANATSDKDVNQLVKKVHTLVAQELETPTMGLA
jgi:1-acyl-sn-glycerol-3-phosphate acyltransferase